MCWCWFYFYARMKTCIYRPISKSLTFTESIYYCFAIRKTYKFTDFACPFGILIVTTKSKKLNSNTKSTSIHNDIELFKTEWSQWLMETNKRTPLDVLDTHFNCYFCSQWTFERINGCYAKPIPFLSPKRVSSLQNWRENFFGKLVNVWFVYQKRFVLTKLNH